MSFKVHQFKSDEILIVKDNSVVGQGAYGVVHRGMHKVYGDVAVKCSIINGRHKAKERIKEEMEYLHQASHENVVRIFGCSILMKTLALVMEFLPGGNLMELLENEDVILSPLLRLRFCAEISSGIAFIHNLPGKRIVHGDIKAENILLTSYLQCKLADFGEAMLSAYTGDQIPNGDHQRKHKFTLIYAAPELLLDTIGERQPGHDTFSFAITVYAVLNRKLPISFEKDIPIYLEMVKAIQRPSIGNLKTWKEDLAEKGHIKDARIIQILVQLMQECWEHKMTLRPNMLEVKERLYKHLEKSQPCEILKHVAEATKKAKLSKPCCSRKLVPLNDIVLPHYADTHDCLEVASMAFSEFGGRSSQQEGGSVQCSDKPLPKKEEMLSTHECGVMEANYRKGSDVAKQMHAPKRISYTLPTSGSALEESVIRKHVHKTANGCQTKVDDFCASSYTDKIKVSNLSPPQMSTSAKQFQLTNASSGQNYNKPSTISEPKLVSSTSTEAHRCKHRNISFSRKAVVSTTETKHGEHAIVEEIETIKDLLKSNYIQQAVLRSNQLVTNTFLLRNIPNCDVVIEDVFMISRWMEELQPTQHVVTSIMLINWCIHLCDHITQLVKKFTILEECSNRFHHVTQLMFKSGMLNEISSYSLPFLEKLYKTKLTCTSVDQKWNEIVSITCSLNIAHCHFYLGQYTEAEDISNRCLTQISELLRDRARTHVLYAKCHYFLAKVNHGMEKNSMAKQLCQKAIEALKIATNIDKSKRKDEIAEIKKFKQSLSPMINKLKSLRRGRTSTLTP